MPASFAVDLCKYRTKNGKPNTSDASDKASVNLGEALFEVLGVPRTSKGDEPTGSPFANRVAQDLADHVAGTPTPVGVQPEKRLNEFAQYHHVAALDDIDIEPSKEYARSWRALRREVEKRIVSPATAVKRSTALLEAVESAVSVEVEKRRRVLSEVGRESLLKLDVTASEPSDGRLPELVIGLSLKWSLRTDRAQDCRSQGAKLSALRRGRMPHFAAVTMEHRPYMLNLLGGGSGDIDCVYHLDLPALSLAMEAVYGSRTDKNSRNTVTTFQRLVEQRRLRDYDELVKYAISL